MGYDLKFNPSPGDWPKDLTTILPAGLLANASLAGGACLTFSSPQSACQIANGTATVGGSQLSAAQYLVQAPKASDVAGVALVIGGNRVDTGDLTLRTSPDVGLNLTFANLPPGNGLSELNVTLSNLRLPTNCPAPPADVTVTADSQDDSTNQTANAPLAVTGCGSLPYLPKLTATVKADRSLGAEILAGISQAAGESASKSIELDLPSSLFVNVSAAASCVMGTPCTVGTAVATSPLIPSLALAHGTLTLGGSVSAPTITISFPPPFAFSIVGEVGLTSNSVVFESEPDVPLTSLGIDITGQGRAKAFETTCKPSSLIGKFTAQQGGPAQTVSAPIAYSGCPGNPTASGSFNGLASGHPNLRLKVAHGHNAPNLASVSIGAPSGLKWVLVKVMHCTGKGHKRKCTTTIKGLSVSGGPVRQVRLKSGRLLISLKKAAPRVSITAGGPLLVESNALRSRVKKHKTKSLDLSIKVTDAKKASTTIRLKLKV